MPVLGNSHVNIDAETSPNPLKNFTPGQSPACVLVDPEETWHSVKGE